MSITPVKRENPGWPKRSYAAWGTRPGSIRPVEYANLCYIVNGISEQWEPDRELYERLVNNKEYAFPEDHPLRSIDCSNVRVFERGEEKSVDGAVIALDEDHAIVVFECTDPTHNGFVDVAADLDLIRYCVARDVSLLVPERDLGESIIMEIQAARAVIREVRQSGFKNMMVCGHSLGGLLAAMCADYDYVREIYSIDSPGMSKKTAAELNRYGSKVTYIRNRYSEVSELGSYMKKAARREIELTGTWMENHSGPFTNHSIKSMRNTLGSSGTSMQEDADKWENEWKKEISAPDYEPGRLSGEDFKIRYKGPWYVGFTKKDW